MQFEDPSEKVCEWILEYFLYAKLSSLAESLSFSHHHLTHQQKHYNYSMG